MNHIHSSVIMIDRSFIRQEVNLVVTQQIERGRGGLLNFCGASTYVLVGLRAKVTLITSLSEFISVF